MLTGTGVQVGSANRFGINFGAPNATASDGTTVFMFHARRAYTLDTVTGVATQIGDNDLGLSVNPQFRAAMYYNNLITVYGITENQLYTLDTDTNTVTALGASITIGGSASIPTITGITVLGPRVYAAEAFTDALYILDVPTGVLTIVDGNTTNFGFTTVNIQALTAYKDTLVAVDLIANRLVELSEVDGVGTVINNIDSPDTGIVGMAQHIDDLLAVGTGGDALYRMYDVLWDETIADFEVDEGADATFDLAAISQDASLFSLQGTPPSWLSITGAETDLVATAAPDVTADTNFDVVVRATRSGINVDETLRIVVRNVATDASFGSETIADQSFGIGDTVNLTLPEATGVGTITYALTPTVPDGLTFDATARTITGTTTTAFASEEFTYTATDSNGTTASLMFDMAVVEMLEIDGTVPEQLWVTGTAIVDVELPAASGGVGAITYALTPALPAGVSLTGRVISGTPTTTVAQTEYTWTATDEDSTSGDITFNITVGNPIILTPDIIPDQMFTAGEAVDFTFPRASDNTTGAITLSLSPALPTGLSFDATTRELTGKPREVIGGRLYTYTAENAVTRATLSFRVYVRPTAYTLANSDLQSLLPPNATPWELAVESMLRETYLPVDDNLHIKMPIIDAWNPDEIPAHLLPYLGINLSVEVDDALPEEEQRNLLKAAFGIHSYEGTPQALLDIIIALGFAGAVIQEGVEDPSDMTTHWAHYSILINQPITIAEAQRMVELVKDAAPSRCNLVSVDVSASAQVYDSTLTYDGANTYGQIDTISGLIL